MKNTLEKIAVMQAYVDGKPIEAKTRGTGWTVIAGIGWNWELCDYRIAATKPSINWEHVSEEYNWMATDKNGQTYLLKEKPHKESYGAWDTEDDDVFPIINVTGFASFTPGTCDWKDSLVKRGE